MTLMSEAPEYRPRIVHYDGEGDPHWQFRSPRRYHQTGRDGMSFLTPKRRAWLEHLRDHGPACSGTVTGYHCRRLKLTEWYVTLKDGRQMPKSAVLSTSAIDWEKTGDMECITDLGRAVLNTRQGETG